MTVQFIISKLLSNYKNIAYGISSRGLKYTSTFQNNLSYSVGDDPEMVSENRNIFYSSLGIQKSQVVSLKQIHSSNSLIVENPGEHYNADAIITNKSNLFLQVSIADCVPILIYDPISQVVAAVHAGWRGTNSEIAFKSVIKIIEVYNIKSKNLIAFIGPSAGECCYEVGEETWKKFNTKYLKKHSFDLKKRFLNVKKANYDQLLKAGMLKNNIEVSQYCTICDNQFHSFRRDGKNSGRMFAVIGIRV